MRHDFLDRYSRLDSPIHRVRAAMKLIAALALVFAMVLVPPSRPVFLAAMAVFLVAVAGLSRVPWRFLVWRVILLEPFVLGVAILAVFQPGGWRLFLFLVAKCTLCLMVMVLLSNTTPFADLLRVLKNWRMPALLGDDALADVPLRLRAGGRGAAHAAGEDEPDLYAPACPDMAHDGHRDQPAVHPLERARRADLRRHVRQGVAMTAAIEVRDLRFRYGDGTHALRGVSFSIAEGESGGTDRPQRRRQEHAAAAPERPTAGVLARRELGVRGRKPGEFGDPARRPPQGGSALPGRQRPALLPDCVRGCCVRPPATRPERSRRFGSVSCRPSQRRVSRGSRRAPRTT